MTTHKLPAGGSIFLEGTHGCYASLEVRGFREINGQTNVELAVMAHRGGAREGQPAGPLSAFCCEAMIEGILAAMQFLDKLKATNPAAAEPLAKLVHAEKLFHAEIDQPQAKSLLKFAKKGEAAV